MYECLKVFELFFLILLNFKILKFKELIMFNSGIML